MSALPPISSRPASPAASPASDQAVRDARALFFKALGEATAATAAPATAKPAYAAPAPAVAAAPRAEDAQRPRRPGSLLDIRV